MWATVVAKYMFQNDPHYIFAIKPLFNFLLWLNYQWAASLDLHPMIMGRLFMAINGVLCATLVGKISYHLTKDQRAFWLSFFLLLGFSTFVKRGGHVRSDLLVSTFIVLGLYLQVLKNCKIASTFFYLMAMLVTPKAGLFSIPLIVFLYKDWLFNKKVIIPFAGFFVLTIILSNTIQTAVLNSWNFFISSFSTQETGFSYFDPIRFIHVVRFFSENIILITFVLTILLYALLQKQNKIKIPDAILIAVSIACLIFLFYPDRLPFLIASLLPFFVLFFVLRSWRVLQKKWIFQGLLVISFLSFGYWAYKIPQEHSNKEQRLLADWLDQQFVSMPNLSIWDPSGVLAKAKAHYFFLGPAQSKDNYGSLHFVQNGEVDIFLYTAKAFYIEPELSAGLMQHYNDLGGGVYIKRETEKKMNKIQLYEIQKSFSRELQNKSLAKIYRFDFEY